jgi:hypothetical protein
MARKDPERSVVVAYQVPLKNEVPADAERRVAETLHASSMTALRTGTTSWKAVLPWQTRVFGVIPRDVDENLDLSVVRRLDMWELVVRCHPVETHSAHATGVAAVIFIAISVWIATGFLTGLAAAITTLLAGALVVEFTRQWAFDALERRLRRLAGDVGSALWPGRPAQIVDSA